MELILALGCLLSELGHEHLVAFAQDRALTLQADSLEVDQKGRRLGIPHIGLQQTGCRRIPCSLLSRQRCDR